MTHLLTRGQGFEKWAEVTGSAAAQVLDLFPILQKLPKALVPNYRYAEALHKEEKKLYVGHWLNAKKAIKDGTGKVGIPIIGRLGTTG